VLPLGTRLLSRHPFEQIFYLGHLLGNIPTVMGRSQREVHQQYKKVTLICASFKMKLETLGAGARWYILFTPTRGSDGNNIAMLAM
jgi:hypothetical protein